MPSRKCKYIVRPREELSKLEWTNNPVFFDTFVPTVATALKEELAIKLAYLEHISAFSILLAYDLLEHPVAPLSGASRPPRGLG